MATDNTIGRKTQASYVGRTSISPWQRAVLFSVGYFVCAEAGRILSGRESTYVSFWLPAGLYVAVLLLNESRTWPWLVLAAFPANLVFDLIHGTKFITLLLFYFANTVQAVIGAWLVRRFVAERPTLGKLKEFVGLLGFAAVLGPSLAAVIGAVTLTASGLSHSFVQSWQVWWGSNAMAILLLSPFILTWFSKSEAKDQHFDQPKKMLEAALLFSVLIALTLHLLLVDKGIMSPNKGRLLLPLLWAGLRFGSRGAAAANLLLALLITFFTTRFFTGLTQDQISSGQYLFILQTWLAVAALVGLIPAIVLRELYQTTAKLRESEEHYRNLTAAAFEGIGISENGRFVDVNDQLLKMFGYERDEIIGREVIELVAPESRSIVAESIRLVREEIYQHRLLRRDGSFFLAEARAKMVRVGHRSLRMTALRDITERKQAEELTHTQRQVLEMIAIGKPMVETLDVLLRMTESQSAEMLCSILLLDPDGIHIRHGAAPSLPVDYLKAIDGSTIGPRAGSCGTAAFRREAVFVADIMSDPLWTDYKQLARPYGLRACWSTPIIDAQRTVLGTFAIYYRHPGMPNERHLRLIDMATQTAAVCIAKDRSDRALRESEDRYRTVVEFFPECVAVSVDDRLVYVNPAGAKLIVGAKGLEGRTTLLGRPVYDFMPVALREFIRETRRDVLQDGIAGPLIQGSLVRPDGSSVTAEGRAIPFVYNGRPAILSVIRDISEYKRAESALRESEEKFSKAFRSSPDAVALSELETGRYIDVNEGYERLFGFSREEIIGRTPLELGIYQDPQDRVRLVEELRAQGLVRDIELRGLNRHRQPLTCLYGGELVELGGRPCIVSVIHDITDRVRAEQALRENQRTLSTLLSNLPGIVYRCRNDADWTMEFISEGCRELTGYAPQELLGNRNISYAQIIHPDHQRAVFGAVQTALGERQPFELTYRIRTINGMEKWVWERGRGIFSASGELLALEGFVTDITARRQAEIERADALLRERQAREEYTHLLIASQEAERRRIAGELHDSLSQNLLLIKNRAQLALSFADTPPDLRQQLENISQMAVVAIVEVRQISHVLHPYQLDHLGLTAALEAMIDSAAQSGTVTFERKLDAVDDAFPLDAATNLYRVVQESLNNILKHAQARRVRIELERDLHQARLWIEDDGRGFEFAQNGTLGGLGLRNIAERVRILGGSLRVDSRPGQGTRIEVMVPIPNRD